MKAWLCTAPGPLEDLRVHDVVPAALGERDVRIRVRACGINFPDILFIEGRYQVKPSLPFAPGGEVSGTIAEMGPAVSGREIGQRVMATIFWGGLAEFAVAPVQAIVDVPASMDLLTAAVFQGGHATAHYALKQRAALRPGETLLVLGAAGGVGMAAMQIGRALGARVIGVVGSGRKAEALRAEGFDEIVDAGRDSLRDTVRGMTGGAGADVVLDPVGGELFGQASRLVRRNARILVVGFASGAIPQYATNLALLKESALIGVNYQQFFVHEPAKVQRNFVELAALFERGAIRPRIDRQFAFGEAVAALAAVRDRSIIGKAVVSMEH